MDWIKTDKNCTIVKSLYYLFKFFLLSFLFVLFDTIVYNDGATFCLWRSISFIIFITSILSLNGISLCFKTNKSLYVTCICIKVKNKKCILYVNMLEKISFCFCFWWSLCVFLCLFRWHFIEIICLNQKNIYKNINIQTFIWLVYRILCNKRQIKWNSSALLNCNLTLQHFKARK